MAFKRYCLALDLKPEATLIAEYEAMHRQVWPAILDSIREAGIAQMEIYRIGNRLFMIMEVTPDFSFEKKQALDSGNPKVREWEELMWKYQQALPTAKPNEKWLLMDRIFAL